MSDALNGGVMLALLAAGSSRRFGEQDKLTAKLGDKMLGVLTAESLLRVSCAKRIVIAPDDHPCTQQWTDLGYNMHANEHRADGQAVSVRIAAKAALDSGSSALVICLADMPFVSAMVVDQLIQKFDECGGAKVIASTAGQAVMPPAIFPVNSLNQLASLTGDEGGRALLKNAECIAVNERILMDIDTIEDMERANEIWRDNN